MISWRYCPSTKMHTSAYWIPSCVTLPIYLPIPARPLIPGRFITASWRASSTSNQLSQAHWSETALAKAGVLITPALVSDALATYWQLFAKGLVGHKKVYTPFDKDASGWTEGALVGFFDKYSGVKDIHFAPDNAGLGKPLQHVDILLRNKVNGDRLMSLEGTAISNGRTGWFALTWLNLILKGKQDINVFLFGAGKVAEAVILALDYGAADRIGQVAVLSRNGISNRKLVDKLQPNLRFQLHAVYTRKLLPNADLVITATNAGRPVFQSEEIAQNAATLSLGIDDMPADYFERIVREGGLIVGDDLAEMEARNADPVALYYSRRGMKLTQHGRDDGVRNYIEVLADTALMRKLESWEGPANFSPVGLASCDLAVAAHVYEVLKTTLSA